jgi:hypothetical protein
LARLSHRQNGSGRRTRRTVKLGEADLGITVDLAVSSFAAELSHQLVDLA